MDNLKTIMLNAASILREIEDEIKKELNIHDTDLKLKTVSVKYDIISVECHVRNSVDSSLVEELVKYFGPHYKVTNSNYLNLVIRFLISPRDE